MAEAAEWVAPSSELNSIVEGRMRGIRIVVSTIALALLVAFVVNAQGQSSEQRNRAQMPRLGAVSMIGVRLSDVTPEQVKTFKLPKAEGAVVESVNSNSPASAAGLRAQDVI